MPDPAWVALSLLDHVGGKKLRALLDHFEGDLRAVLAADEKALRRVPGIGPKIAAAIRALDLAEIERALPIWEAAGVCLLALGDPAYPANLAALDDAPPTLFVRGNWSDARPAVAVVGTRQPGDAARDAAFRIGAALARRGTVVVSGLAYGVDAAAHQGALSVDGCTVAVLGSGVLTIYPQEHARLAAAILARGALVSEVRPDAHPTPSNLVARNRLISGLADALIVVETSLTGGAMHAARRAFEQGRTVYALDCAADGNRALLAAGAFALDLSLGEL